MNDTVAVLGASNNPDRYAYQAIKQLAEQGYRVFLVLPTERIINGIPCYSHIGAIAQPVDTITVYLSPKNSTPLIEEILGLAPRRIILNPGAENDELSRRCQSAGIQVLAACTLVLVRTGQF